MPPPITPQEQAQLARENAQCLLVNNFGIILENSDVLEPGKGVYSEIPSARNVLVPNGPLYSQGAKLPLNTLQTLITYHGRADELVNALTMDTPDKIPPTAFINATPAQLSMLQPRLDFYIRTNITDPNDPTHVLPKDRQIIFSDHVTAETQKKVASGRSGDSVGILRGAKGHNVGIKEFNWNYDNKHEGDRIIKAQLTLYFGSMAELTNEYYLDFLFADGKRNVHQRTAAENQTRQEKIRELSESLRSRQSQVQRGTLQARVQSNVLRDSQQLKVIVGWEMPDRVIPDLFSNAEEQKQFYTAVKNSQRTLLLNITQYDINFNQNGSCEVVIEYIASTDAYIGSPASDIFSGRNLPPYIENQDFGVVAGQRSWLDLDGRRSELWPDGYLKARFDDAYNSLPTGTLSDYEVSLKVDAVIAEVEWLEEKLQLLELQGANNPGASNSQAAQQHEKFKEYFSVASEILQECYFSARSIKYQNFFSRLLESDKVFYVEASLESVQGTQRQGVPPKYISVRKAGSATNAPGYQNTTRPGSGGRQNLGFKSRFLGLAEAQAQAQAQGLTVDEFLSTNANNVFDPNRSAQGILSPTSANGRTNPRQVVPGDTRNLYYIRLGDLIQAASDAAGLTMENQIVMGTFYPRLAKFRYGLVGTPPGAAGGAAAGAAAGGGTPTPPPMKKLTDAPESLANLPISLEYFGNWFYENVISVEREQYFFRRFLDDVLNGLVQPILNTMCGDQKTLRLGYTLHTVAADVLPNTIAAGNQVSIYPPREENPYSLQFGVDGFVDAVRKAAFKGAQAGQDELMTTLILIHAEQVNVKRTGSVEDDQRDGVYHFFLGSDRGLVKQFNFSKKQMPQLRAMNIERVNKGATKAGILVLPMDVSLTMFGNGLLRNGSMIFVNADFGVGTRVADQLALGGYYRVYKSSNTIRPGFFETVVDCIFERPRNFPDD